GLHAGAGRAHDDVTHASFDNAAERPAEGVGEDERSGDEGDAEDDCEGTHGQAQLARHEALPACSEHQCVPAAAATISSRWAIRSSTDSRVGSRSSPTIRPSARKTTRSV